MVSGLAVEADDPASRQPETETADHRVRLPPHGVPHRNRRPSRSESRCVVWNRPTPTPSRPSVPTPHGSPQAGPDRSRLPPRGTAGPAVDRKGRLLSVACACFRGSRHEDVAVFTVQDRRRHRIAPARVNARCEDIVARNRTPSWNRSVPNRASRLLAWYAGFRLVDKYVHYAVGSPVSPTGSAPSDHATKTTPPGRRPYSRCRGPQRTCERRGSVALHHTECPLPTSRISGGFAVEPACERSDLLLRPR
ncbi:GNAT family N-acetyltransferase [Streptomyces sp. NPDC051740]|uniref:GNAT family N-acetyltransferase n=1 Tax=Streptomyces sp. NPDC051740 TaxID=3365673 RepID=UPI00378EE5E2